jgi:hypothetical protein
MERIFYVEREGKFEPPPQPAPGSLRRLLRKFRRRLKRIAPTTAPISRDEFLDCYKGRKRRVYESAAESLDVTQVERKDAFLSSFVKPEKTNITEKGDPAPRVIQPRSARYNVRVGQYIKPIEHTLYHAIDVIFGAPTVAKGKNAIQRAAMLKEAWDSMDDPVAVLLDARRFDQHVSEDALGWEHSVYNALFMNDPELQRLLAWQLDNRGFIYCADGSVKYRVRGRRASGDMNTALGNVLLMCALMWTYLREIAGKAFRLINDGDDCVVILERRHFQTLKSTYKEWFRKCGFTMKLDGYTDKFEKISFCQAQPVFDGERWVMVRDPRVTLDKDNISVKPIPDERTWLLQRKAISQCGLALAGNIPVYGAFYSMLDVKGVEVERGLETGMDYLARGMEGGRRAVAPEARASYFMAFNITPDEQVALEEFYDGITLRYETPLASWDIHEPFTDILTIAKEQ